jgi:predicted glycosyltransferase
LNTERICPRIAVYTHDTFGLGHIRRCLHIITQLAKESPKSAILLVTGSPALHFLKDLPPNVDVVKIPTIVKTGALGSLPPHIPLGLAEMTLLRSRIIRETVLAFQPDVFLVDNFPLGAQSELLPVLTALHATRTRTILGLRDILDDPAVVKKEWKHKGVYDVMDRYYDRILIYGEREIFDAVRNYDIPPSIEKKVRFCGYLTATEPVDEAAGELRRALEGEGRLIVATGGGGGDAFPLLSALIDAVPKVSNSRALIFGGPLMGEKDRMELREKVNGDPRIKFKDSVPDFRAHMKAADLVVTMCGYNLAAEIVCHRPKAIVVPRTWRFGEHANRGSSSEEKEQVLRARMLKKFGIVEMLEPEELTPEALAEKISKVLNAPAGSGSRINIDGLNNAVGHIQELMGL